MGKSDKKLKSNRINALRKQYDAFLEEDKKRRERNEYILGKLDNMRYATSVVPLRHKPNPFTVGTRNPGVYNRSTYIPDDLERNSTRVTRPKENNLQLDVPKTYIDDIPLIQEISKRFILIPRTRPTYENDYVEDIKSKVQDNSDWKSKYDILEQLKKKEKEEQPEKHDLASTNENLAKLNINGDSLKYNGIKDAYNFEVPTKCDNEEIPMKCEVELPVKDTPKNEFLQDQIYKPYDFGDSYAVNTNDSHQNANTLGTKNVEQMYTEYPEESIVQNSEVHVAPFENTVITNLTEEAMLDTTLNHNIEKFPEDTTVLNSTEVSNVFEENNENTEMQEELPPFEIAEYEQSPIEEENNIQGDTDKVIYLEEGDTSQVEVMNPTDFVKEINNEAPIEQVQLPDNIENPTEPENTPEYLPNENIQVGNGVDPSKVEEHTENQNNADDSQLYDTQNPAVAEKTDNPPINSDPNQAEIEAFDAEQREMFYSENAEENSAYNPEGEPLAHNYEYSIQDPNYQQGEEYAYYEGQTTNQAYPPEINEHEETSQPYDQTYEEQYAKYEEQQHYDQQPIYDPALPQYQEQPYVYDETQQQQDFDQMQYQQENDTSPGVEAQLDKEEGYVEQQNEEKDSKSEVMETQQVHKAETENVK